MATRAIPVTGGRLSTKFTPICTHRPKAGRGRRNVALDAAFGMNVRSLGHARIDFEVVRALRREPLGGKEFREGIISISASHPIVFRSARLRNRGNYRARRLYSQSHPFNVAVRWEAFDDDGLGRVLGAWTVRDRFAVGGKYTMFEHIPEIVYAAVEYRDTRYRLPAGSTGLVTSAAEVTFRVGVEF